MKLDYQTEVTAIDGERRSLEAHIGAVLLIVNTASQCGFTPQYDGLEALHGEYGPRGLVVLGFPCDQFGRQEPGTDAEIAEFCKVNHGVTFPIHSKIEVNGGGAHPLFRQLKAARPGILGTQRIKWNFTKFLVDRAGEIVARFGPRDTPASLRPRIEALLDA